MTIVPQPLTQTAELRQMAGKLAALAADVQDKFPQLIRTVSSAVPASLTASGAPQTNVDAVTAEMVFQLKKIAAAMGHVTEGCRDLSLATEEAVRIRVTADRNLTSAN